MIYGMFVKVLKKKMIYGMFVKVLMRCHSAYVSEGNNMAYIKRIIRLAKYNIEHVCIQLQNPGSTTNACLHHQKKT